jgi:hypothetical protein
MNSMEFFYLLEFLKKQQDFKLISLISPLKILGTKKEVRELLTKHFGPEELKLVPDIDSFDLINLIIGELGTRNLN